MRPPQFAADRDDTDRDDDTDIDDNDIVAHLSRVLDSMSGPAPTVAKTPPPEGNGASTAGPSKPIWAHSAPTSVPGSPRPAAPRSSSNGGRPRPGAPRPKASNPAASKPGSDPAHNPTPKLAASNPGPTGYRNPRASGTGFGPNRPSDPDGLGPTLVPDGPNSDPAGLGGYDHSADPSVTDDSRPRPAGTSSDAGPNPTPNRSEGYGRPSTGATAFSDPSGLPESLKAFAPGAPDTQMEVAAIVGSPRWRPGDDDVIPGDGRKGLRRPRLRDRLGI